VTEQLPFRAHARLLTMLGEQLIKNERIALVELVKNAYDADATLVTVDFQNFGDAFAPRLDSAIVITDNGSGMPRSVIGGVWMNPATPSKAITKLASPRTQLGRVLQGEKGIGRFATFKLGNDLALASRVGGEPLETTLLVDISILDDEAEALVTDMYLDDVVAVIEDSAPHVFDGVGGPASTHGTQLRISGLRADWNYRLVREAFADLDRLQPVLWAHGNGSDLAVDFDVKFLRDGVDLDLGAERTEEFQAVLERAVLRVLDGRYDDELHQFRFNLDGRDVLLPLVDPEVTALRRFRTHFQSDGQWRQPSCGSFGFEFFVFDFSATAPAEHALDSEEKALLRSHRIYLYRDGIRVYPYGDPKDDWLEIDAIRGTESARSMFSNDQSVGFITISQAENPSLRDKTNREGLLESGNATGDFVALIQTVLSYLRSKPYEQYATANRRVRERDLREHRLERYIASLRSDFSLPPKALEQLDALQNAIDAERELSAMQVARTEQLAGVGLSVETASHDLIAAAIEALRSARHIVSELRLLDLANEPVFGIATTLVTRLEFVNARFKDVQGLFVSTRQKSGPIDVGQLMRRVKSMYSGLHEEAGIEFQIEEPLAINAVSTEAAVLQCLINLVDNATFWLMNSPHKPRLIRAFARDSLALVLTDNGPGVKPQDEPFIFEAFYSGKGDSGKGLGLYIATQNGLRSGFSVELTNTSDARDLDGATFAVEFKQGKVAQ
jgi:signal transduction histidine kinase